MQNSNFQYKDSQKELKDRVKKILTHAGFQQCYSEADFICFAKQTEGNFSQAFDIAKLFIEENKNFVNDYSYDYAN